MPSDPPTRDLRYAYSLGERVLTWKRDEVGAMRATADVLPTLRIADAELNGAGDDYIARDDEQRPRLAGMAEVRWVPGLPSPTGSGVHMFQTLSDELGSSTVVLEHATGKLAERATYQPYGATEQDTRPTRWGAHRASLRFTGKEDDLEVGLTYFGARYYAPNLGQWASADPLTVHAMGADLNPYAYVAGRVSTHVDPLGLQGTRAEPPYDVVDVRGPPRKGAHEPLDRSDRIPGDGSSLGPQAFAPPPGRGAGGGVITRWATDAGKRLLGGLLSAQQRASAFEIGLLHNIPIFAFTPALTVGGVFASVVPANDRPYMHAGHAAGIVASVVGGGLAARAGLGAAGAVPALEATAVRAESALSGALLRQQLAAEEIAGARMPSAITGYTRHGLNQAISRDGVGVSAGAIGEAVSNPFRIIGQAGGRFEFWGANARVVLNESGEVITVWSRNSAGWRFVP